MTMPRMTDAERAYVHIATRQYLGTMLWADSLDDTYQMDDFALSAVKSSLTEVADFVVANWDDLTDIDAEQAGHDFLLTRDGHGVGFWDRGLGEVGDRLTRACGSYGASDAYVGDDGKVYVA